MYDKSQYPFKSHFLELNNLNYHYLDEGSGRPMLMVHGNPTWSFYYRNLVKYFKHTHRVVVPDHMGCGLSSKTEDYNYTLKQRIDDLKKLILFLDLKDITLVVHDWGGAIGFGALKDLKQRFKNIIVLNTAAFHLDRIPKRIALCKNKYFGEFLVRNLNGFAYPATFMTTVKPLSANVKKSYLHPYDSVHNRRAVYEFVNDIPLTNDHPSYNDLIAIENSLDEVDLPIKILWGAKDFCFNDEFFAKWKNIFPESEHVYFKDAGHYVLEDKPDECISHIESFIE